MKRIIFILILCGLNANVLKAQDFTDIDNFAKSVKYTRDLEKLTNKLTAPYNDDLSKVRAIFVCLATNIEYDHKKLAKMKSNGYKMKKLYGSKEEIKRQQLEEIQSFIEETLDDRKGVCQDFAYLFQAMCIHAGLECEFVTGTGKNNPAMLGNANMSSKHAWNAVKIDGKWSLMDVTWSTGMEEKEDFGNGFFNLPPTTMIMSHYPTEEKWQLLDSVVSKQYFADMPYIAASFIKYGVSELTPYSGKVQNKSKISFKAQLPESSTILVYKGKVAQKVTFKQEGDTYSLDLKGLSLLGNIDICIKLASGRWERLYTIKLVS
jgi:transglutaminase/protease-like cytokinesis protein 3